MKKKDLELLQELRILAKKDRILTTVVDMTALGLVELTRKKQQNRLAEQLTQNNFFYIIGKLRIQNQIERAGAQFFTL